MIASLPMYDLAPVAAATDAWWRGLAGHLRAAGVAGVPDRLTPGADLLASWRAPDLLLSQTCGYPLTHALAGEVQLVATPCYNAPGCEGPRYASAIVVSADSEAERLTELAGSVAVINGADSQSGCNVLRYMTAQASNGRPLFSRIEVSGAHVASIDAVARGRADVAAVDAVTHALLLRHAPAALAGTRVLMFSPTAPALPYITHRDVADAELACLRAGLKAAVADPALAAIRRDLLLEDFEVLPAAAYQAIVDMEHAADRSGLARWPYK